MTRKMRQTKNLERSIRCSRIDRSSLTEKAPLLRGFFVAGMCRKQAKEKGAGSLRPPNLVPLPVAYMPEPGP